MGVIASASCAWGVPGAFAAIPQPSTQDAIKKLDPKVPGADYGKLLDVAALPACQDKDVAGAAVGGFSMGSSAAAVLNRDPETISCGELKKDKGIENLLKSLQEGKTALIRADKSLNCAMAASDTLIKSLASYRTQLDQTLTTAGEQLLKANQYLEDLKAKAEFTDKEVLPDLIQGKKDLEDFARSIDANVVTVGTGVRQLRNRKINLEQQKQAFQMSDAMSCFKNQVGGSDSTCLDAAGNPMAVSAFDAAVCIYEGRSGAKAGGGVATRRIDPNDRRALLVAAQAKAKITAALNDLMKSVQSNTSVGTPAPGAPVQAPGLTQYRSLTLGDVRDKFRERLTPFDSVGEPISGFVLGQIQRCYDQSKGAMENAAKLKSSPIGLEADAIITQEDSLKAMNQAKFKEAQILFERVNSATTRFSGGGSSMNISACEQSQVEGQLSCLQQVRTSLTGLLTGQSAQAINTLRIQGTNQGTAQPITCAGLNGCINALRKYRTDLATESATGSQAITAFKSMLYRNVGSQIASQAALFNPYSIAIQNQVGTASRILSGLGVFTAPIKFNKSPNAQLTVDDKGMTVLPNDIGAMMGNMANPPIQEMDASSVEKVKAAVAKKILAAEDLEVAINAKAKKCSAEDTENLRGMISSWNKCLNNKSFVCDGSGQENQFLTQMNKLVSEKENMKVGEAFNFSSIRHGIKTESLCGGLKLAAENSKLDVTKDEVVVELNRKLQDIAPKVALANISGDESDECRNFLSTQGSPQVIEQRQSKNKPGCEAKRKEVENLRSRISERVRELEKKKEKAVEELASVAEQGWSGERNEKVPSCDQIPNALTQKVKDYEETHGKKKSSNAQSGG